MNLSDIYFNRNVASGQNRRINKKRQRNCRRFCPLRC